MKFSRIAGTGSYLPEKIVTNADLEKILDTSDEWIRDRTGICERRVAYEGETSGDMAEVAAQRAMEAAGIDPQTFTDQVSLKFRDLSSLLQLSNDDFIRTTEARHRTSCQAIWRRLVEAGVEAAVVVGEHVRFVHAGERMLL